MSGPTTMREALMAEVLGDVGKVMDRVEAIGPVIEAAAKAAASDVATSGDAAAANIARAGKDAVQSLSKIAALVDGSLSREVARVVKASDELASRTQRLVMVALVLGAIAGGLAGAGVVFVLAH